MLPFNHLERTLNRKGNRTALLLELATMMDSNVVIWAVGTTNQAKLQCVRDAVQMCFPNQGNEIVALSVESGVSSQPMSAEECMSGAQQRADEALRLSSSAQYGVGIEGGVERIAGKWFECGWLCVVHRESGRRGFGSSARFEMSDKLMKGILEDKKELAEIIDEITGETDVRSKLGAMGVLTNGHLGRAAAYSHGMMFALAPFLSSREKFWD